MGRRHPSSELRFFTCRSCTELRNTSKRSTALQDGTACTALLCSLRGAARGGGAAGSRKASSDRSHGLCAIRTPQSQSQEAQSERKALVQRARAVRERREPQLCPMPSELSTPLPRHTGLPAHTSSTRHLHPLFLAFALTAEGGKKHHLRGVKPPEGCTQPRVTNSPSC